jgi:opacity protein-like surface antigen
MEAHIDHWSESQEAFGAKTSVSDMNLGARGKYFFPVANAKVQPFVGAGLGLHFVSAKVSIPAFGSQPEMSVKDSATKLGLDLGGGMATALSPRMDLWTELWYGAASDVNQVSLRAGMAWKIGS